MYRYLIYQNQLKKRVLHIIRLKTLQSFELLF